MTTRKKPQTIEYAFRYAKETHTEQSRMLEMIRVNLGALMGMVALTHNGEEIQVDGFCLRDNPETIYKLDTPVPQAEGT